MNLLILDGPAYGPAASMNTKYRGTERSIPYYRASESADAEVNVLFLWYLEEGGESGVVHDMANAVRYAELLNATAQDPGERFEVVEAVPVGSAPQAGATLLGFDLSHGFGNSLITEGLSIKEDLSGDSWPEAFEVFRGIRERHGPAINEFGLLPSWEAARACLSDMAVLLDQFPGFLEYGDYEVLGIYSVTPPG